VRKPSNHADNESKPGSANTGARSVITIKTQRRQDGAATKKTTTEEMNNVRRRDNKYKKWPSLTGFQANSQN